MTDRNVPNIEPSPPPAAEANPLPKVCPVCGCRFPAADKFCATDGQPLRDIRPEADPLVGSVIGDRYFVHRRLGQGGMGVVYLAEHVRIGRQVAVKVLLPEYANNVEAVARFNREAANLSRVNHPNVAGLFDYGESAGGLLYLAMEFVDGEPLSVLLARETTLSVGRVATVVAQTAAALHAAHGLGIVHRDLKPENIIVSRGTADTEVVKVVDFGIARAVKETAQRVTEAGAVIGTLAYMSPEQLNGEDVDSRSDLYSLALLTCVMLTGKLPFRSDSQKAILERLSVPPAPLATLAPDTDWPIALQLALTRALSIDRAERQTSTQAFAREVIDGLEAWRPGVISPLVRALGLLGQDVVATLSPDVIIRHVTPVSHQPPLEATGRKQRRWMWPTIGSVAAVAAVSAIAMSLTARDPGKGAGADSSEVPPVTSGKNSSVSITSIQSDSAAIPNANRGTGTSAPSQPAARGRSGDTPRVNLPTSLHVPSNPTASPAASDPKAAALSTAPAADSSGSQPEPTPPPPPPVPVDGVVQIGTHESGVILIVNDRANGPLTRLGLIRVPIGTVRLRLRAEQCQDWDSTVTVRGGDTVRIGFRRPQC